MTQFTTLQQKIHEILPEINLKLHENLSEHTSFKIGGPAEIMAFPKSRNELRNLLAFADEYRCPCRILGAGTNILAPDSGLDGVTICMKDAFNGVRLGDAGTVIVSAGTTMTRAASFAARHALAGMEFAHGIPGTIGGGIYMNAGAYGGELKDICVSVETMDMQGYTHIYDKDQMCFSYRSSILQQKQEIVISATFALSQDDPERIKARMKELKAKRSASQPLKLPSAGSAFKRPEGAYAAALIDQAGLKGFRVGDAAVSEKHAGFVVNLGNATASDVRVLLEQVSDRVRLHSGYSLQPEIRIW